MTATSHRNFTYTFDISSADASLLNDKASCEAIIKDIVRIAEMTELQSLTHRFSPQGVSVVTLLAESHVALHTWPELQSGYITLTTCKKPSDEFSNQAATLIEKAFEAAAVKVSTL